MAGFNSDANNAYSKYSSMSMDELKQAMHQLMQLPNNSFDADEVIYLARLIDEKQELTQNQSHHIMDADASWEIFRTKQSLENTPRKVSIHKRPRARMRKVAIVAVIIAILFALGAITAGAAQLDIFKTVVKWSKETFTFTQAPQGEESTARNAQYHPLLNQMAEYMQQYHADYLLPSYLPEGFEVTEYYEYGTFNTAPSVFITLSDGEEELLISYFFHFNSDISYGSYEKNPGPPEIYESNGTTYYITQNVDLWGATWLSDDGKVECDIYGLIDKDEILKIVDSINGD